MSARTTQRLAVGLGWIGVVAAYVAYTRSNDLSTLEAAEELRAALAGNWWGPALFVAVYTLRPLVLFPASILTILGGLAFGPIWGTIWTTAAANLSTTTTYGVGRTFGNPDVAGRLSRVLGNTVARARRNPFETTLIMRLLYLPFDAVGYVAGFVHLRFAPFIAGSALGILPGTVAFVGFGASIDSLDEGTPSFDLRILAASVVLAVAGTVVSRWLRRRRPDLAPHEASVDAPSGDATAEVRA